MQAVYSSVSPLAQLVEEGAVSSFARNLKLPFGVDTFRERVQALDVSVREVTEKELIPPVPYKDSEWDVAPSTRRKHPTTWDMAVGSISWILYVVACNAEEIGLALADQILATGSKFLEPAADYKHLVGVPVYAPMQEWVDKATEVIFRIQTVSSSSPDSFVEWGRNNGKKVVVTEVTNRMNLILDLFMVQWLNLGLQLATQQERVYIASLKTMLKVEGTFVDQKEENAAIFKAAIPFLERNVEGQKTLFKLLKVISAQKKHIGALYGAKAWDEGDRAKVALAAVVAKISRKDGLKQALIVEAVLSWVMNINPSTEKVMDYIPLTPENKGLIEAGLISSFGFSLYAYNKDVLYAAFLVRNGRMSASEAMVQVTNANGRKWKSYAEEMITEVAKDGKYCYEGSDFKTDFSAQLGNSLFPLSSYLLRAPSAIPKRETDGKIKRYMPLKALRVGEYKLSQMPIVTYQEIFGGEVNFDKDEVIGVRLAESLGSTNPAAILKVEIPNVGTEFRLVKDQLKVGDKLFCNIGGDHTIWGIKTLGGKLEKRLGLFGLYAQGWIETGHLEPEILDVPVEDHDTTEGFCMVHPDDVKHAPGILVQARGAWDRDENGELKVVVRVHPKCPRGKILFTPGFVKGKELKVIKGSTKIAYGYIHDPKKKATTNRSLFHRTDLMLHACGEESKKLETSVVKAKAVLAAKRIMGTVPCAPAFNIIAEQTIGNGDNFRNGNMDIDLSQALFLRVAFERLGEYVEDNELVINSIGEGIVSLATFKRIAKVTGGPDMDDVFMCLVLSELIEILRNPQCAGDGYDEVASIRYEV